MKAIQLNGFGDVSNFSLSHLDPPVIKNDEVLIQIKAAAFNPIDYQMRLGLRESRLMRSPILGRELSGVVLQVGTDVIGVKPGDEVMALAGSRGSNGSYAELMALNYRMIGSKPRHINFEEAAAIPSSGLTAWHSFTRMQAEVSDSIFINGAAGGVGRFLIKLLKANGVSNIVATAGSGESIAALQSLGLGSGQIINYNQPGLKDLLIAANHGKRFDYAVDLVGGTIAETTADVLRMNGNYVDVTFLGTVVTREILFDKGANILNIAAYAFAIENNLTWYGDTLNHLAQLIEAHKIDAPAVNVIGNLTVETAQEAHRLMEANRIYGKKLVMSVTA
ncbi:NADPH:quinone reductase [Mucilaginibacter gossypiicola]|uniref:NADPH:quinone reductase n=1 Tax=Mucilaginibacter gossypiicola TaxID=551995 RepID=A0A1H8S846_9SPHI|nr:NADP-dependent oxidoreductase [Mucilaginibacter gossypiicola]SEO74564.1 NADPH:quinone reductase [Mucilaginibacter gossypiicola]